MNALSWVSPPLISRPHTRGLIVGYPVSIFEDKYDKPKIFNLDAQVENSTAFWTFRSNSKQPAGDLSSALGGCRRRRQLSNRPGNGDALVHA